MRKFSSFRLMVGLIVCGSMLLPESFTSTRNQLNAQEVGFLEDFALAQDREKALKQLVPGTESYYYFHALHYQNTQQLDKVDQLIETATFTTPLCGRTLSCAMTPIHCESSWLTIKRSPLAAAKRFSQNC